MTKDSKQIDAYIESAPEFAQPILIKLRKAVNKGCPEAAEVIKWGCPYFEHHGLLCGMAAFKAHVSFGFWKSKEMDDPAGLFETGTGPKASMCNAHFKSIKSVPTQKVLLDYIRRAKKINESVSSQTKGNKKPSPRNKIVVPKLPNEFVVAMKKSKKAKTFFNSLPPSHKRDYVEWIIDAKREPTKAKRIATAIQWLGEGKRRNWKYESTKRK